MWCPDGFFLVRELFNESADLSFELSVTPPEWLDSIGTLSDAFDAIAEGYEGSFLPAGFRTTQIDPNYLIGREWGDIYSEALHHWLLGRLLFEGRYKLFLVSQSGSCVRVSSEVASFLTGLDAENCHKFPYFPRDARTIMSLAFGGAPLNARFPRPAYTLRTGDVPEEITSIFHLETQQLAQMNGAPLLWKADKVLTPRLALSRFIKELNQLPPELDEDRAASRKPPKIRILELSAEGFPRADIAKQFPLLSSRAFDKHWRDASLMNPDISKPGRKT